MSILIIDFMNLCHRARSGYLLGPAPVIYNFFRQFQALINQFKPTKIYIVLEGYPVARYKLLPEYKATRLVTKDDPKYAELIKFFAQKDIIVELLSLYFPVTVVHHPTFECDDTIYNLVNQNNTEQITIVSNDSDFIQILQKFEYVKIWNPIKKIYVKAPIDYDYITWKSLRGDGSDNIPGIFGIGDKKATLIASNYDKLLNFLNDPKLAIIFQRNYNLIAFKNWSDEEQIKMTSTIPTCNWDEIKSTFNTYGFNSITNDISWNKFINTFNYLF